MNTLVLIIGKESNLSTQLDKKIKNSIVLSARELQEDIEILAQYQTQKLSIILNNFQSATQLGCLHDVESYIANSIGLTSKVLAYIKDFHIEKIIYTSSSSVYGNNILCKESDELKPMNLHASLKVANEKLIERYCTEHKIDYTITRIFNMYGGDDKFSVISKIINAYKKNEVLTIVNHGNAIRDFIHISDVVDIYAKLFFINVDILNIGTGEGISIKSLLDFLQYRGVYLKVENITSQELKISTADNSRIRHILGMERFRKVEDYIARVLSL